MNAFVTGGHGYIGRYVLALLLSRGHAVSALTRNYSAGLSCKTKWIVGDLTVDGALDRISFADVDVLFHCAGEIKDRTRMRGLHVDGTRRLLKLVSQAAEHRRKPLHWVQLSSVGVYGPPQPRANVERVVTENTPEAPVGEYEITKTESDHLVQEAARNGILTYSILRPSNVFGRQMPNGSLRSLIKYVQKGLFFYIGGPGAISTYVHVDDVAEALLKCGTDPRAIGEVFNLSYDCPLEEMIRGIAEASQTRSPSVRLPEGFVRAMVRAFAGISSFPLSPTRISALVCRTTYPTTKIQQQLDFKPARSVPDAIRELVSGSQ